jgi:RNA-directed DNA polymerase
MASAEGAPREWKLPAIVTTGDLADHLRVHPDDLGWLTSRGKAEHYRHRWQAKPKSGRFRLIESPKALLKHVQRQVMRRLLDAIPPHESAKGFRRGTSVRDFTGPHTGKRVVLRFDLEDFFPSISAARVLRLWLTAGYPEPVARALTRLTTRATPVLELLERPLAWIERRRLATPHLPQGAPTSPALANLCAFRLDCRLAGLARECGADYTRYADDLLFSGDEDFSPKVKRFIATVGAIAIEEGFRLNHHKTRVMKESTRQHAAGMVLNEKPNLDRREFDRLKAILTNCVRHGPASQNREGHPEFAAHLLGKLAWVDFINPAKGAKLRAIHARIGWDGRGRAPGEN